MAAVPELFLLIFLAVAGIIALIDIILILRSVNRLRWERKNRIHGIEAAGRVTGVRTVRGYGSTDSYGPRAYRQVVFRTETGEEFLVEAPASGRRVATNTTVAVRYHPTNPRRATVTGRLPYARNVASLVFALVFLVLLAGFIAFAATALTDGRWPFDSFYAGYRGSATG